MAEDVAFFRFDSNADAVASDIAGAMAKINSAMSKPMPQQDLTRTTNSLGGVFKGMDTELGKARAEVNSLLGRAASGTIDPTQFKSEFQRVVRKAVSTIPTTMANELGTASNQTAAGRANVAQMARGIGQSYVDTLTDTVRFGRTKVGGALKGLRLDPRTFAGDLNALEQNPAAFGKESSQIASLRNQLRAEKFLKADPTGIATRGVAEQAGFSRQYMDDLRARATVPTEKGRRFTGTGAAEEIASLKLIDAAARQTAIGFEKYAAELTKATIATERQALAQKLVDQGAVKTGSGRYKLGNEHLRLTPDGAVRETNPARIREGNEVIAKREAAAVAADTLAWEKYARELTKADVAAQKLAATQERLDARTTAAANKAAIRAEATRTRADAASARAELVNQQKNAGFAGGAVNRLTKGGNSALTTLGGSVASAAQFSIGYGALFGSVGAAKDTLAEFNDYQDSLTDLEVATRRTDVVTTGFVDDLGEMSRMVGENLGSALDTAARGIRAFGNPLTDTKEELQQIGLEANEAANKLALVAGKSLKDATGDAVAVGTAYGLDPDQLNQIVDAVANAKKLGADSGQISQGLASISTSAQAAGYDLNQAAALISLVQSRTDESGQAVATRLTKVFQTTTGSTGKKLGAELGVNTDQSVRAQLEDYAKIYSNPDTSKAVKDRISSALGGTANLKELLPVLQEGAALQQAYGDAATSAGQGTSEFERKSGNLTGTLKKITGDVKAIQVDLARTGLLNPFGVLIYTLEPVLNLLDRMLKLLNSMPGPVKDITAGLVDLAVASKIIGVVATARAASAAPKAAEALMAARTLPAVATWGALPVAAGGAAPAAGTAAKAATNAAKVEAAAVSSGSMWGFKARRAEAAAIALAAEQRAAAEALANRGIVASAAMRKEAEVAGTVGAAGGAARLLKFMTNPYVIAGGILIGAALVLENGLKGLDQRDKFLTSYAGTSKAYARSDGSAQGLREAANDLKSTAGNIEKSDASTFVAKSTQKSLVADLTRQQGDLNTLARRVAAEDKRTASVAPSSVFGQGGVITTIGELASGLSTLAGNGVTATEQVRLLNKALNDTATPEVGQRYEGDELSARFATKGIAGLAAAVPNTIQRPRETGAYSTYSGGSPDISYEDVSKKEFLPGLNKDNRATRIADAVKKAASEAGISQGDVLTDEQKTLLATAAANAYNLKSLGKDSEKVRAKILAILLEDAGVRRQGADGLVDDVIAFLGVPKKVSGRQGLLNGKGKLSNDQITELLQPSENGDFQGLPSILDASLTAIPTGDDGTKKLSALKANRDLVRGIKKRSNGKNAELNLVVSNAEDAYSTAMVERLNDLRVVAQNGAAGNKGKVRAIGLASLQKQIAQAGSDTRLLAEIMATANQAALDIVRATLKKAADLANAAQMQSDLLNNTVKFDAGFNIVPSDTKEQSALEAFDATRATTNIPKTGGVLATGSDSANYEPDKAKEDERTRAQRRAQAAASRVNPDDTVGQARADLTSAQADLAAAKRGSEEWNTAYQAMLSARNALGDAVRGYAAASARANIDPDDAVGMAAADLNAARATLGGATRGTQEYAEAQAGVNQSVDAFQKAQADKTGAIASANAARVGGGIASARAQITAAAATMRATAKGTAAYFQALAGFYSGQQAMRDAIQAYAAAKDQLRGDITDPVENARDSLRAAARKLGADRHAGQAKDVIAEDKVAARQAKEELAAAKFSQRFSDMQTAEDLGRIGFRKYMTYLDHEHDRLSAIKHRTRQQQDQLDQVDQAMKAALDSMDGQFNLGDINTNGLVYQTRRFAAEGRANAGAASAARVVTTNNQTVDIKINGADTAKVRSILDTYLRIGGGQRQSLTRRKV